MTALVSVDNLTVRFGDVEAVRNISLRVGRGEVVTLVGPSGCGKSSILRCVAGLEQPSEGAVALEDDARIGFVFQDAALLPWANVASNVVLPLKLAGEKKPMPKVFTALDRVGLAERYTAFPSELSGGMRMRVSIARALASTPQIMLMDEPFAALDELRRFDLARMVREIAADDGLSVLFVTHSVFEACFLSDRVVILSSGPGQITEDVAIQAPGKRDDTFRESEIFSAAAAQVSTALRAAAGGLA
ncbi:MAG: ABC transporter ATP-binding protein [Pseudomonadota bacterium]